MTPCLDSLEGIDSFGSRPRLGALISICPASSMIGIDATRQGRLGMAQCSVPPWRIRA
jgi:hypothetical protein